MLYFGYSYCPDVCPLDLQKLMQGYRLFEKQDPARAAKVQPIFITIDPQRDTPQVLKNYVSAFHPQLIGDRKSVVYGKRVPLRAAPPAPPPPHPPTPPHPPPP